MRTQDRLTDPSYWDSTWKHNRASSRATIQDHETVRLPESPAISEFWDNLLAPHLPAAPAKVVELGSAPGLRLLNWRRRFGYEIFGADFSKEGIQQQNALFIDLGIDLSRSIYADFLDPSFTEKYRESFDVVYSGGVIEHFTEPEEVIAVHVELLKSNGLLVIFIPNLQGIYRHLLPRWIVAKHNLDIMRLPVFKGLFAKPELQTLFCGYQGRLNFGVAMFDESLYCRLLNWAQFFGNLLLRTVPVPENRFTSPNLLYIGRKRSG